MMVRAHRIRTKVPEATPTIIPIWVVVKGVPARRVKQTNLKQNIEVETCE